MTLHSKEHRGGASTGICGEGRSRAARSRWSAPGAAGGLRPRRLKSRQSPPVDAIRHTEVSAIDIASIRAQVDVGVAIAELFRVGLTQTV
jgi:hypothetical protein